MDDNNYLNSSRDSYPPLSALAYLYKYDYRADKNASISNILLSIPA